MFKSKYSTVLTIVLIILIVAILVISLIIGIRTYKSINDNNEKSRIYAELKTGEIESEVTEQEEQESDDDIDFIIPTVDIDENTSTSNSGNSSSSSTRRKAQMYKNYPVAGYIKIAKTKVSYPILLDISPGALDTAVGIMYPTNPTLNQPGNVVIIGHNYRNGKFFSNNKKLVVGDKIEITDLTGKTLTYTIYEIFQTTETDTEYVTRDRGNNTEISLSTCTDDGMARLVILARVS